MGSAAVRAITLWQPWASFMVAAPDPLKSIETRSWSTTYRGPLLIHAAKREPAWVRNLFLENQPLLRLLVTLRRNASGQFFLADVFDSLPRGAILGGGTLVGCEPTERVSVAPDSSEGRLGDYSPGRWAWGITRAYSLREPVAANGKQGLWAPSPELMSAVVRMGAADA